MFAIPEKKIPSIVLIIGTVKELQLNEKISVFVIQRALKLYDISAF